MKTIKIVLEIITLLIPLVKYLYMMKKNKKSVVHTNKPVKLKKQLKQLTLWLDSKEEEQKENSRKEIN